MRKKWEYKDLNEEVIKAEHATTEPEGIILPFKIVALHAIQTLSPISIGEG